MYSERHIIARAKAYGATKDMQSNLLRIMNAMREAQADARASRIQSATLTAIGDQVKALVQTFPKASQARLKATVKIIQDVIKSLTRYLNKFGQFTTPDNPVKGLDVMMQAFRNITAEVRKAKIR